MILVDSSGFIATARVERAGLVTSDDDFDGLPAFTYFAKKTGPKGCAR